MDYYAFGGTLSSYVNGNSVDKYKFTGKERDSETGLDYFGARYYDSKIGRWLSVDPLADTYPGLSPYIYCLNNPLRLIDPKGMAAAAARPDNPGDGDENTSLWDKFRKFMNAITSSKYQEDTEEKDVSPTNNMQTIDAMDKAAKVADKLSNDAKTNTVQIADKGQSLLSQTNAICSNAALVTVPGSPLSISFTIAAKMSGGLALGFSLTKWAITGDNKDRNTALANLMGLGVGALINKVVAPSSTISVGQSDLLQDVMGNSANVISYAIGAGLHL